jgi:acetyl esterase/lipase
VRQCSIEIAEREEMTEEIPKLAITKREVVYRIPGMESLRVQRDVEFRRDYDAALTMDIYYPPESKSGERTPAVIFVIGYPDQGVKSIFGCTSKEMGSYISWARLAAASGLAAITYTNRDPATDVHLALQYVRKNAASLGIDEHRIGVWSCSGNVPVALSVLLQDSQEFLQCAVLCYGFMLDWDGTTFVADASNQWKFVNASAGKSVADFPRDLPLFIVRAGQDEFPHLNETIDRFVIDALARNLAITLVNHSTGGHAFDVSDDREASREVVRRILSFMRFHLLSSEPERRGDGATR